MVETYAGSAGGAYFTNAVTEIVVEAGARVDHYKLQRESERAFHVSTLAVRAGPRRDASRTTRSAWAARWCASTSRSRFAGQGGECALYGLFVATATQHTDTHTLVDHAAPHCTSRELYKGMLGGRARGVFHGKVLVRQDAQKTNAYQANQNLLLSREALVQQHAARWRSSPTT